MKKSIGLILLLAAIAIVGAVVFLNKAPSLTTVKGYAGSEKMAIFQNPKIKQLLAEKYGLKIDVTKAGSVEMVQSPHTTHDFLWPGSQLNVDMYRSAGGKVVKSEGIFHSPLVLYTWSQIADGLEQSGYVEKIDGVSYLSDFKGLLEAIEAKKTWNELGIADIDRSFMIKSTDPSRSNSGNLYAALLANTFSEDDIAKRGQLATLMPRLQTYFERLGYMEHSSGVLFRQYIGQGMANVPPIAGYESQIIEHIAANKDSVAAIRGKLSILYPKPTVWSGHPMIALTETGSLLLEAMKDPEFLAIAWQDHGFRSGTIGNPNDLSVFEITGVPQSITSVSGIPSAKFLSEMVEKLGE